MRQSYARCTALVPANFQRPKLRAFLFHEKQLPTLSVDGKIVCQGTAMLRYCGKLTGEMVVKESGQSGSSTCECSVKNWHACLRYVESSVYLFRLLHRREMSLERLPQVAESHSRTKMTCSAQEYMHVHCAGCN
jgi:hypothetical protein